MGRENKTNFGFSRDNNLRYFNDPDVDFDSIHKKIFENGNYGGHSNFGSRKLNKYEIINKSEKYIVYKVGDVLYNAVQGELKGCMFPTYYISNILEVTRETGNYIVYTVQGVLKKDKCKENNHSIRAHYITYREMCDDAIDMNLDKFPYRRELSLVVSAHEYNFPELYI